MKDRSTTQEPGSKSTATPTSRQGVTGEDLTRAVAGNVIEKQDLTQGTPSGQAKSSGQAAPSEQAKSSAQAPSSGQVKSPGQATPAEPSTRGAQPTRFEAIQLAAYLRAERRGFSPGYEMEDWLAAEREIAEREGAGTVG